MPLLKGKSKSVISANIGELIHSFKQKGSIGTSHPGSILQAKKQAIAIAYSKAGKSKKKSATMRGLKRGLTGK